MPSDEWDQSTAIVSGEGAPTPGEPRFTPGAVIGNRYRIVSLLGAGGMGEVYRADDMKLGQRVALKFLPRRIAGDPRAFERVRSEVRIGRQISHPNICRIHDIVEVDGQHFISMEYVDGEDLASLLRRIGRLPTDKALALARALAAGLVAAHSRGIVHRDLKPANIMVDGEGSCRIMDFGLAALSQELEKRREVAGTPKYMAPEQFLGQDITQRTDIYAFGLILYEMFTGRQVFGGMAVSEIVSAHSFGKARPSSLVRDIDPVVEKVILRCVEERPEDRPASMQAVLAALPGGDALREAVEAGETPSPALVAAGGDAGDLEVRQAWLLLAGVVVALLLTAAIANRWLLPGMVPDIRSRDTLRDRASEILKDFGNPRPRAVDGWYRSNWGYLSWLAKHGGIRGGALAQSPPSGVIFVYRSSPLPLVAYNRNKQVRWSDPAEDVTGMSTMILDHTGRLRYFRTVPPERVETAAAEFDWGRAFQAAGLDIRAFTPAEPVWSSPYGSDRRAAWTGTYPNRRDVAIRIEVASRAGRPVYFQVVEPWDEPASVQPDSSIGSYMFTLVTFLSIVAAGVIARRNLARGRGDRRGAFRVAAFTGICLLIGRFGIATHSSDVVEEWGVIVDLLMLTLFRAATVWLLYLAVEPYVRRQWPRMLITTSRLFAGRPRDPLVGRDILNGAIGGGLAAAATHLRTAVAAWSGATNVWPLNSLASETMDSPLGFVWVLFGVPAVATIVALVALTLLVLFRLVLRSYVAAMVAIGVCLSLVFYGGGISPVRIAFEMVAMAILLVVLHRHGAFAFVVGYTYWEVLVRGCLTFDFAAWYSLRSTATLVFLAAVAIWGFYISLGGKPVLGKSMLDEEAPV